MTQQKAAGLLRRLFVLRELPAWASALLDIQPDGPDRLAAAGQALPWGTLPASSGVRQAPQ